MLFFIFLTGILYKSSWISPNGHKKPQISRPNNNPNNNNNKIVLISREILDNTQAIFRVDKNELIESELTKKNAYNIVDINLDNKIKLLEQMKSGNVFYIRMNIKDSSSDIGSKQITAKLNLADFSKALIYYDSMAKKAI